MKKLSFIAYLLGAIALLCVAVVLLLTGKKNTVPSPQPQNIIEAVFLCPENKSVQATFNTDARSVSLRLSDGRVLSLPQAISASGARYANTDESFVFWNKGDTAFIQENGTTTYNNCKTREE